MSLTTSNDMLIDSTYKFQETFGVGEQSLRDLATTALKERSTSDLTAHVDRLINQLYVTEGCEVFLILGNKLKAYSLISVMDTVHWGTLPVEIAIATSPDITRDEFKAFSNHRGLVLRSQGFGTYLRTRYSSGSYITRESKL